MKNLQAIKKHKLLLVLGLITVLAAFLRFYKLSSLPALNADEAALGYNAYSLIKTGLDEHGNPWPVHFQSFNDYKPGLTVYLIIPFVSIFGLNEWAVRFLPALLGVLTVPLLFLLIKELVGERKDSNFIATVGALLLAVSPWHIHFSRGAWEVNIATFFLVAGLYCLFLFLRKSVFFYYSTLMFVLSLYTYHAARVIAPLLCFCFTCLYFPYLLKKWKVVLLSIFFALILLIPLFKDLIGPAGISRAAGVGILSDMGPVNRANELRGQYANPNGVLAKILNTRQEQYALEFMRNWSEHYWGQFLFLSSDDIQRNEVPETGLFHLPELVFILVGTYMVAKVVNKRWTIILFWLLIAPIPAALTFQSPHALRSASMVIPLTILSAFGAVAIYKWGNRHKKYLCNVIIPSILCLSMIYFFARYVHEYYGHMAVSLPFSSQYGVKELVTYLTPIKDNYKTIVVTDRYDQPYILFLFYLKYDPAIFQKEHTLTGRDNFGFSTVSSFGNFRFTSIEYEADKLIYDKALLIGTDTEIPKEANIIKDIYGSNGYRYFRVEAN